MQNFYDFHVHTNYSDGWDSPSDVVEKAYNKGLEAIAITDHDSIAGWSEAEETGDRLGVFVVKGIELSVWHQFCDGRVKELHLLGYNFDKDYSPLAKYLDSVWEKKFQRAVSMTEMVNHNLKKKGFKPIRDEELEKLVQDSCGMFGLARLGDYLVEKGLALNNHDAYEEYMRGCHIVNGFIHLPEASQLLREAGGFSCLAHPYNSARSIYNNSKPIVENLISETERYVDAVEVYCFSHGWEETNEMTRLANKYNLDASGGSDHHKEDRIGSVDFPESVGNLFFESSPFIDKEKKVTNSCH